VFLEQFALGGVHVVSSAPRAALRERRVAGGRSRERLGSLTEVADRYIFDIGDDTLAVGFFQGLLPVRGSELEGAVSGPAREQVEEVADVAGRLDVVEASAREERDEAGVVTAPSSLPTKSRLRSAQRFARVI